MWNDEIPRRRAGGYRSLATFLLGLLLCLPAVIGSADPGDPRATPPPPDGDRSQRSEAVEREEGQARQEPRPDSARKREKRAFQPSEKIPADIPSDFPTDI